jgi:hypothetical protein
VLVQRLCWAPRASRAACLLDVVDRFLDHLCSRTSQRGGASSGGTSATNATSTNSATAARGAGGVFGEGGGPAADDVNVRQHDTARRQGVQDSGGGGGNDEGDFAFAHHVLRRCTVLLSSAVAERGEGRRGGDGGGGRAVAAAVATMPLRGGCVAPTLRRRLACTRVALHVLTQRYAPHLLPQSLPHHLQSPLLLAQRHNDYVGGSGGDAGYVGSSSSSGGGGGGGSSRGTGAHDASTMLAVAGLPADLGWFNLQRARAAVQLKGMCAAGDFDHGGSRSGSGGGDRGGVGNRGGSGGSRGPVDSVVSEEAGSGDDALRTLEMRQVLSSLTPLTVALQAFHDSFAAQYGRPSSLEASASAAPVDWGPDPASWPLNDSSSSIREGSTDSSSAGALATTTTATTSTNMAATRPAFNSLATAAGHNLAAGARLYGLAFSAATAKQALELARVLALAELDTMRRLSRARHRTRQPSNQQRAEARQQQQQQQGRSMGAAARGEGDDDGDKQSPLLPQHQQHQHQKAVIGALLRFAMDVVGGNCADAVRVLEEATHALSLDSHPNDHGGGTTNDMVTSFDRALTFSVVHYCLQPTVLHDVLEAAAVAETVAVEEVKRSARSVSVGDAHRHWMDAAGVAVADTTRSRLAKTLLAFLGPVDAMLWSPQHVQCHLALAAAAGWPEYVLRVLLRTNAGGGGGGDGDEDGRQNGDGGNHHDDGDRGNHGDDDSGGDDDDRAWAAAIEYAAAVVMQLRGTDAQQSSLPLRTQNTAGMWENPAAYLGLPTVSQPPRATVQVLLKLLLVHALLHDGRAGEARAATPSAQIDWSRRNKRVQQVLELVPPSWRMENALRLVEAALKDAGPHAGPMPMRLLAPLMRRLTV